MGIIVFKHKIIMSSNPYSNVASSDAMADLSKEGRRKYREEKTIKEALDQRLYGKLLLQVPKNLLKIGLLFLLVAAIRMIVLMKNNQKLDEFIQSQEVMDFSQHKVHPLFAYMTKNLDPK